jgi:hypothetical protein
MEAAMSIDSFKIQASAAPSKQEAYIPVPANFFTSPKALVLIGSAGAAGLGAFFEIIGLLRAQPGYKVESEDFHAWRLFKGYDLTPLFALKFLIEEASYISSPLLNAWMAPYDQKMQRISEQRAEAARARRANPQQTSASDSKPEQSDACLVLSDLISSDLIRSKKGGAGENTPPVTAAPEPVPPAEEPPELEEVPVEAKTPPKHIELFPADPENNLPAGYLSEIEYDQYRATSGEVLIKRAAKLVRDHWIKKPSKPVKKLTAEMTWALTEARKQVADDMTSQTRAVRARAGPNCLPAPISPALRKPTIAGG